MIVECRKEAIRFLAVLVLPETRGRCLITGGGECIGCRAVGCSEHVELSCGVLRGERHQRCHGRPEALQQLTRSNPVRIPEAADGALTPATVARLALGALEARLDAVEPVAEVDGAQRRELHETCGAAHVAHGQPEPCQRMLE